MTFGISLIDSPNAIIRLSAELNVIRFNEAAEKFYSNAEQNIIGCNIINLLPDFFGRGKGLLSRILLGEAIEHCEIERKKPNHESIYISVSVYPITCSSNELTGAWVIARDITAKKQAIAKTISNERRLKALIENVTDGISMPDATGIMSYQNKAMDEILGYSLEDRQRIPIKEIIHPDHFESYFQVPASLRATPGIPGHFEFLFKHKHGHYKWLEGVLINMLHNRDVQAYVVNCRDITQRKEIEEKLIASEIRFKALIEHSQEAILLADANGVTVYKSPGANRMSGFVDEMRKDIHHQTHPDDIAGAVASYQKALDNPGVPIPIEARYIHKTKGYFLASGFLVNLIGVPGINGVISNLRDITERRKIEENVLQLTQALEVKVIQRTSELELANKELEAFSYSVSHDLRAPLRSINGYSEILLEDHLESLDKKGQKALRVIVKNAKKMGQLIDDLLEFSRVGRTALQYSSINMNELAKEVLQELANSGIVIPANVVFHPMKVAYGDVNLIKVIWTNLVSNAVKYSSKHEMPTIEVGMMKEGEDQFYYVKDNGAGFDMQYANKLFGVFQRLHKQEDFAGTGVGLALAHRIVARHGGIIKTQSEVGKGATFMFTLPFSTQEVS